MIDSIVNTFLELSPWFLLGMVIFVLFPFTRLVHIWSVPVQYLTRSNYQIVRRRY